MEMNRLARQNDSGSVVKVTDQNSIDDMTPWLLRTKWPQMFVGKDLSLSSSAIRDTQTLIQLPVACFRSGRRCGHGS